MPGLAGKGSGPVRHFFVDEFAEPAVLLKEAVVRKEDAVCIQHFFIQLALLLDPGQVRSVPPVDGNRKNNNPQYKYQQDDPAPPLESLPTAGRTRLEYLLFGMKR